MYRYISHKNTILHRYTWTHLDRLKEIEVRSNPKLKLFEFYMDGVLRTESKYFLRGANNVFAAWDSSAPASKTYTLCTVKEYVNGLLKLRVGRGMAVTALRGFDWLIFFRQKIQNHC